MTEKRFLPTDIDSSKELAWNKLKEQALCLVHQELREKQKLHDDATVAVLNDYDNMDPEAFLQQLLTFSLVLGTLNNRASFKKMQACFLDT